MLVKWGSIIVKGSGKLGGHVFSSGRSGASVHTLARARNPQTKYQSEVRSRFTKFTQSWRNLTETERESWYDAESSFSRVNRFGDLVTLTGKNLFESLNTQRAIKGLGVVNTAPMPAEFLKNTVSQARFVVRFNLLEISGDYVANTQYVIVASKGLSQGVRYSSEDMKIIGVAVSRGDGVPFNVFGNLFSLYTAKFGRPNADSKVFVGSYFINNSGQKGNISRVSAVFE